MNSAALICLLTFIESLVLGYIIVSRNPESNVNRLFLAYIVLFGCSSFVEFQLYTSGSASVFRLWKHADFFVIAAVTVMLHFAVVYNEHPLMRSRVFIRLLYACGAVGVLVQALIVQPESTAVTSWGYRSVYSSFAQFAYDMNAAFFTFVAVVAVIISWVSTVRTNQARRRSGRMFLAVTLTLLLVIGFIFEVIVPLVLRLALPVSASTAFLVINPLFVIAVVRFGILEISPQAALKVILQKMSDGLILTDLNGIVHFANHSAQVMTGAVPLEGVSIESLFVSTSGHPAGDIVPVQASSSQTISDRELYLNRPDLPSLPVSVSATVHDTEKWGPTGLIYVVRDISARRQADQARLDVERVLRHDMRTPLTGIIGLPDAIRDDTNLTEEQREILGLITRSGRMILSQIETYLSFYRMESGTFVPTLQNVNVTRLVEDVIATLKSPAHSCGVMFDIRGPDTPVFALAEEPLLFSLLGNIIKNAYEASPRDSTVTVRVVDGEKINIVVHNKGEVPEEIRDRFFEKNVTFGKAGGIGLGTYSALLIARSLGGTIRFISDATEGTTLSVELKSPTVSAGPAA